MRLQLPILLFLFGILPSITSAQSVLDSLLSIDQFHEPPRKNVFTNINISREYFVLGEYDAGFSYGKKAMEIANELENDTLLGQSAFFSGLNAFEMNADSGFRYYKISAELLLALKHEWAAFAINNLCTEYTELSWYAEALEYRLKSLDFFKELADTTMIVHTMVRVGYIHDRIGEYDEALSWYEKAEPIAIAQRDTLGIADVYAYRGIAYDELELYDSAHYYNKKAIQLFKAIGEIYAYSIWCSNIGNTYLKQENYEMAEQYLLESLATSDETDQEDKSIKLINLSKVYYHDGMYIKGDSTLSKALEIAKNYSQYKFISEAYLTFSESYEDRGLEEDALLAYKKYKIYEDSSFNEEKANQIAYHNAKFNIQEKEKELLLHKNKSQQLENEKLQIELELASRNFWITLLLALLATGGLLSFFVFQHNRRKLEREKNRALLEEKDKGITAVIAAQEQKELELQGITRWYCARINTPQDATSEHDRWWDSSQ